MEFVISDLVVVNLAELRLFLVKEEFLLAVLWPLSMLLGQGASFVVKGEKACSQL